MSRCFAFPPPGYERKRIPDDFNILKEAKRKDKKHKEKGKERKKERENGKDEIDEKQEKKDRKKHKDKKEKHKDKKKNKDHRSKDKSSISEEFTVFGGKLEDRYGKKFYPEGQNNDRSYAVDALFQGQNGGKTSQRGLPSKEHEETKLVLEFGRRISDDGARGSQLPEKLALVDERAQKIAAKAAVGNSSAVLAKEKGSYNDKGIGNRSLDLQGLESLSGGNARVQDFARMDDSKVDRIVRPVNDQKVGRLEGIEKYNEMGDIKRGDKCKDRDKKSHEKEKDREKEKKKEKTKVKTENQKSKQVRLEEMGGNARVSIANSESTDSVKDVNNNGLNDGNVRKRKDTYTNGFVHETEIGANKIQRHAPHQSIENERKLETCRSPAKCYDEHAVPNSVPINSKGPLMNGIVGVQKLFPSIPHQSSAAMFGDHVAQVPTIPNSKSFHLKETWTVPKMEDLIDEALMRPPHPDSKYLSEVLMIPNVIGLPVNDAQEWLFRKAGPLDKPQTGSVGVDNELRVWSEAVHVESADICALPFVIPY